MEFLLHYYVKIIKEKVWDNLLILENKFGMKFCEMKFHSFGIFVSCKMKKKLFQNKIIFFFNYDIHLSFQSYLYNSNLCIEIIIFCRKIKKKFFKIILSTKYFAHNSALSFEIITFLRR